MDIKRILIVDDDELVRNALRRCFRSGGYEVVIVGSSQDAFDQLQERTFALVISDLRSQI